MKVNWKNNQNQSPILFSRHAEWTGFDIRHLRVSAGELVEQTCAAHEINVALAGSIKTEKHSATGKWKHSRYVPGSVCIIPAGQPSRAVWESELECLTIMLNPIFVAQTALEQNFTGGSVEFIETHDRPDPLVQHIGLTLLAEANSNEPVGRMYAESLAQTLILHLLKNYSTAAQKQENTQGGLSGYRLRRAKELLIKGELPLVEVSIQAGFKNQSHFTTLFRKFTALTPKAFREAKHQ